eukprot:1185455-Prymnesium_polylepis.1
MLRPLIYPVIEKHNKEAIVESNETGQGSKVGKAVAASEMGLRADQWDSTLELEGFLDQPFQIKE